MLPSSHESTCLPTRPARPQYAICCPSRSSILTGACAHNHGVIGAGDLPLGGFSRFVGRELEGKAAPLQLQRAGYRTGLVGKYLNSYVNTSHIPPGWERWFAFTVGDIDYYNYTVSDQGRSVHYGTDEEDYSTDVVKRKALDFIRESESDVRPFFAYITPYATHRPHVPAKRHRGVFSGLQVPRVPSWNESDEHVAKKASFVRTAPHITAEVARALDFEYQTRAETLLAVDELIAEVVQALKETGQLDNTYIFFTGDNGFKLGHHRVPGKISPYENDVRLPFYARGPGVPKGLKLDHLVGNIDHAPTWLDLAGIEEDSEHKFRDGISMVPILRGDPAVLADPRRHRVAYLIEKPAASGGVDTFTSILQPPAADPWDDPFEGLRPRQNADGSWPTEVLDWEFLLAGIDPSLKGRSFGERLDERAAKGWAGYPGESVTGFGIYQQLAQAQGISLDSVVRAANEEFPTAYHAIRVHFRDGDRSGKFKLIEFPGGWELYDLHKDPHEVHNIFDQAPRELIAALQGELARLKTCRGPSCHSRNINLLTHEHPYQAARIEL
ncbi:hypothetical protein ABPG77_002005 [Micractinium sp. CCAP 211/92]